MEIRITIHCPKCNQPCSHVKDYQHKETVFCLNCKTELDILYKKDFKVTRKCNAFNQALFYILEVVD